MCVKQSGLQVCVDHVWTKQVDVVNCEGYSNVVYIMNPRYGSVKLVRLTVVLRVLDMDQTDLDWSDTDVRKMGVNLERLYGPYGFRKIWASSRRTEEASWMRGETRLLEKM